jgi:riboflavin-specific deaminase-like protein
MDKAQTNHSFIKEKGKPFIYLNMAMSADGKIASADRKIHSLGSEYDQRHLLELRTEADAILCGANTLNSGPISLGTGGRRYEQMRLRKGRSRHALRIIASGSGSIDPNAEIFKSRFSPIIILTTQRISPCRLKELSEIADEVEMFGEHEIDFNSAMEWLSDKWKVKTLLCEGGGELNEALFRHRLVNELHLTVCPYILGGQSAPTIADGVGVSHLIDAYPMELASVKRIGNEIYLVYRATGVEGPD